MLSEAPSEKGLKALCSVKSDASGKFVIKGVPTGDYVLIPSYRSSDTNYDLLPSRAEITISHGLFNLNENHFFLFSLVDKPFVSTFIDSFELPEAFRVAGFSVGGIVTDAEGHGISGVTVLFNGVERATTDSNG